MQFSHPCFTSDTDQYRTVCCYEVYISLYNNCYVASFKSTCCWFLGLRIFSRLEFISGISAVMVLFLNTLLILFSPLSVYFVTRRHEKQINCEQISPQLQAAADIAKEIKALKTTRIIIMALLVSLFPLFLYVVLWSVSSKNSSYTVNVILLYHPIFIWLSWLNSLGHPLIYCYRNRMFRKTCQELLRIKCTNLIEE